MSRELGWKLAGSRGDHVAKPSWRPVTSDQYWAQSCFTSLVTIWVMGRCAFSKMLMTRTWGEQLTCQGSCCHPEGPQQAGERGGQEHHEAQERNAKSCTWGGTMLGTSMCCGLPAGKQLGRKDWGVLVDKLNMSQWCALAAKEPYSVVGCIRQGIASSQERLSPLYSKAVWTWEAWETGSRWPCVSRKGGHHDIQRSLPSSTILCIWRKTKQLMNVRSVDC